MEQLGFLKKENKHFFDSSEKDSKVNVPHSVYYDDLRYVKDHQFVANKKIKTIKVFESDDKEKYYQIIRKKEVQFLASQLLGGVINISPIYILMRKVIIFLKRLPIKKIYLTLLLDAFFLMF